MSDNDFQLALADITRNLGEKITRILNSQSHNENACKFLQESIANIKRITEGFIKIAEDIANGTLKPDKEFIQDMIDIYKRNPADIPESIRDYVRELAETENTDNRPVIKATTHKANAVMIERSKVGRKLHDPTALATLYDTGGTITTKNKGKKDKKDIDSVVSLSIQEVKDWTAHIPANKTLTKFDFEVLSCAVTLFEAGNKIFTADMIFRLLTGGKTQEPTQAMRNEIYDSLFRLCCTGIIVDATEEFNAGYNGKKEFRGTLLPCGMVIGDTILNGQLVHDCIKIYDTSPLIEYARAKRQVSNIPLGMRNIPNVNSTIDNLVLLGYLIGAFADMRNPHSPVQPIIRYDTLYAYLGVEGKNEKQTYKKKEKTRKTVRDILTAWKEGRFIKDFQELTENNTPAKQGARVAKIKIKLFSQKELQAMRDNEILSLGTGD